MREMSVDLIRDAVAELCVQANTQIGGDILRAVERAQETDESPVARSVLKSIAQNIHIAREEGLPACQDTGMAVVFAEVGQEVLLTGGGFEEAVAEGVRRGYVDGKLRLSVVSDPLRRVNTGDNTPPVLYTRIVPGDRVSLTVAPKGFGSENMSRLKIFTPSASPADLEDFVYETVVTAGSNPCPPVIVGVGIGSTAEGVLLAAKRGLLREVGSLHPDPFYAEMEERLLTRINSSGIGPQGLGGSTTALAVHVTALPTHIAGLPCGVNMGCHVTRHASRIL